MGLYAYINENDRVEMRKVTDPDLNEDFQEALIYDSSLMISERIEYSKRFFFSKLKEVGRYYTIYHETPAHDGSAYMARIQSSACGDKRIVTAYLHGIYNGASKLTPPQPFKH